MAMNVNEELKDEKKPDTSFLKSKFTKKRDQIISPYEAIESPTNAPKSATKKGASKTPEDKVPIKKDLESVADSKLKLSDRTLFVEKYSHTMLSHILVLKGYSKNSEFMFSHSELAQILAIKKNSVRKVLNDLTTNGLVKQLDKPNPKTRTPAKFKITTQIS